MGDDQKYKDVGETVRVVAVRLCAAYWKGRHDSEGADTPLTVKNNEYANWKAWVPAAKNLISASVGSLFE